MTTERSVRLRTRPAPREIPSAAPSRYAPIHLPSVSLDTIPAPIEARLYDGGGQQTSSQDDPPSSAVSYEIGYGKPPRSGCFKKGQLANPKGRPPKKGAKNALTIFLEEADILVTVLENGKKRKMSKLRIGVRKAMNAFAANGDVKAMLPLLKFMHAAYAPKTAPNGSMQPEEQFNPLLEPMEGLFRDVLAALGEEQLAQLPPEY